MCTYFFSFVSITTILFIFCYTGEQLTSQVCSSDLSDSNSRCHPAKIQKYSFKVIFHFVEKLTFDLYFATLCLMTIIGGEGS